jgi:hypothetical protein
LASDSDFHPTTSAILINLAWFLSLTLSLTVTLLAMLVKQWGEEYRSEQDINPPYLQARTRQARYDKLKVWKVDDVIAVLPIVMHVALGE